MNLTRTSGSILKVCVSKPKVVEFKGRLIETGIFKTPVEGQITLSALNLEGDEQADLTVHGGPEKAVYSYASEHYPWWRDEMPDADFDFGAFGENLTTTGLIESEIYIGDEFQAGTAIIRVTQPRLPCYKLGIKFGRTDIIKKFMQSGRSGIYFSVVKEGSLGEGDSLTFIKGDDHHINLRDVANLFNGHKKDAADLDFMRRAMKSQLAAQMKMFIDAEIAEMENRQ